MYKLFSYFCYKILKWGSIRATFIFLLSRCKQMI